jgi:DNA mismatch repair protein MutH
VHAVTESFTHGFGALGDFEDASQLLMRAHTLAGRTLGEVALGLDLPLPAAPSRAKGFVGGLIERALGAPRVSREPTDFPSCELKTLPVDAQGRPRESTFVCCVTLAQLRETPWEASRVRAKLARVLFVPVEAAAEVAHPERRVGRAFLWQMRAEEEALLREDYALLAERVAHCDVEKTDARWGRVLQIRPKGAHAGVRTRAHDLEGVPLRVQPRAFYLRAAFTRELLRDALPHLR